MNELHQALECLRPKDFADVPVDDLKSFLPDILAKAELIANSIPPPPNGTPFESSKRARDDANGARCAADVTVSKVRRPAFKEHEGLHKAWGKPVKLGVKEAATGISVFKMAGHDRHGAWFARTSVHEGLSFAKWKKAMQREFPASLEVQGGPGEGNVRGIGGDQRLEDITVDGIGNLEGRSSLIYQLSAQFPGPTAPREFITLLITSSNCLSNDSKVGDVMPRHFMVVSIPVSHPGAPPRDGMVRGQYESVELIREIPLVNPNAKPDNIERKEHADDDDPETNPVEWIMITRSDPGGGIPRFMVERSTPASIVQDAAKFLNWACAEEDFPTRNDKSSQSSDLQDQQPAQVNLRPSMDRQRPLSIAENNGILAGVGTSIADRPSFVRQPSQRTVEVENTVSNTTDQTDPALSQVLNSLHRTDSRSSSTTSSSSLDSFVSAERYNTASESLPVSPPLSTLSDASIPFPGPSRSSTHLQERHTRELQKIEEKRAKLEQKLDAGRSKAATSGEKNDSKSARELEKAKEKHHREKKKQEEKFAKEVEKLEQRRERETRKLLAKQQKEADKKSLQKAQREREEYKQRAELAEQEIKVLKEQLGVLQRENTVLVAKMGRMEGGVEVLKRVREEVEGKERKRGESTASACSEGSRSPSLKGRKSGLGRQGSGLANIEAHEKS
ncbi:hypothetical protein BU23DRAFT_480895 [Bimuria novae-zelandiae CBS 107.79]|uniref:DUF3074 domain-containing protein n=1 Tax=Bimuria novae-zelandiae CBS 107.79 TaxID=1447943 RepID=A0A6A5UU70_9PLEO|nr:hypothetical protein BU23DRAFT_480895 [Bimuria novae-zelandiae CBS 107.79]